MSNYNVKTHCEHCKEEIQQDISNLGGTVHYVCMNCFAIKEITVVINNWGTSHSYKTILDYAEEFRPVLKWFNRPVNERFKNLCNDLLEKCFWSLRINQYNVYYFKLDVQNLFTTLCSIKNAIIYHGRLELNSFDFLVKDYDSMVISAFENFKRNNLENPKQIEVIDYFIGKIKEWEDTRGFV